MTWKKGTCPSWWRRSWRHSHHFRAASTSTQRSEAEGTLSERRRRNLRNEVLGLCTFRLRRGLEERLAQDEDFTSLLDEVVARRLDPASAATTILKRFDAGEAA